MDVSKANVALKSSHGVLINCSMELGLNRLAKGKSLCVDLALFTIEQMLKCVV